MLLGIMCGRRFAVDSTAKPIPPLDVCWNHNSVIDMSHIYLIYCRAHTQGGDCGCSDVQYDCGCRAQAGAGWRANVRLDGWRL